MSQGSSYSIKIANFGIYKSDLILTKLLVQLFAIPVYLPQPRGVYKVTFCGGGGGQLGSLGEKIRSHPVLAFFRGFLPVS